jgi:hypothetical protein
MKYKQSEQFACILRKVFKDIGRSGIEALACISITDYLLSFSNMYPIISYHIGDFGALHG